MSAKLIICCAGRPAINGHKRRSFTWSDQHGCYVHEGRVLSEAEFNALAQTVMAKNQDLRCFAKVVSDDGVAPTEDPRIALLESRLAEAKTRIESLQGSLLAARASTTPTVEEAIEVLKQLAPERLKAKPGRKPALQE